MNDQTKIMISLGAATAANCIPCFEHLYYHAKKLKISNETIQEIIDISSKVKTGAHIAFKSASDETMGLIDMDGSSDQPSACSCGCIS